MGKTLQGPGDAARFFSAAAREHATPQGRQPPLPLPGPPCLRPLAPAVCAHLRAPDRTQPSRRWCALFWIVCLSIRVRVHLTVSEAWPILFHSWLSSVARNCWRGHQDTAADLCRGGCDKAWTEEGIVCGSVCAACLIGLPYTSKRGWAPSMFARGFYGSCQSDIVCTRVQNISDKVHLTAQGALLPQKSSSMLCRC